MDWNNIVITVGTVLAIFGGIKIISDGITAIKGWIPVANLTKRCDDLETRADDTEREYEHIKKIINAQSQLLIEMTNHMITGNDVDKLKEKRDDLTEAMLE